MKILTLIFLLFLSNLSFSKDNSRTFNLFYPYSFAKQGKSFNYDPYLLFFPHLGDNICRKKGFEIGWDKFLDRKDKIKAWSKYEKNCSKEGIYQLLLGDLYANYGDYISAKEILEKTIRDAKFDTRHHKTLLNIVYLYLKEINKSVDSTVLLIKEYPDFYGGYLSMGANLLRVNEFYKAKEFLEEALLLNQKNTFTYLLLNKVSYKLGEYDKVHLYYEKAFLLNPLVTLMDRSSSLSMLDVHIIEKDFNEANAMITQLLDIDEGIKDDPKFIELQKKFENTFNKLSPK